MTDFLARLQDFVARGQRAQAAVDEILAAPAVARPGWTRHPGVRGVSWRRDRGDWTVVEFFPGTSKPWAVCRRGVKMKRRHGNFEGYWRFKTPENAMRAVDRREAPRKGKKR